MAHLNNNPIQGQLNLIYHVGVDDQKPALSTGHGYFELLELSFFLKKILLCTKFELGTLVMQSSTLPLDQAAKT